MALTICHECSSQVSTEAKSCPSCGAPVKVKITTSGKIAIFVTIAIVSSVFIHHFFRDTTPPQTLTSDQKIKKELESKRTHRAIIATKAVKESLKNPDTVQWESVLLNENGSIICVSYRAQNGLGGYSREFVTFVKEKSSKANDVWDKQCANKKLFDLTSVAKFTN
jgi:hypothetical protein